MSTDLVAVVSLAATVVATVAAFVALPPGRPRRLVLRTSGALLGLLAVVYIAVSLLTGIGDPKNPGPSSTPTASATATPTPTASPTPSPGQVSPTPSKPPTAQPPTHRPSSRPAKSAKTLACNTLRTSALNEETALRDLRSAVIVSDGTVQGKDPAYADRYPAARSAVEDSYARLTSYQQAGGTLPPLGEVDYERDLQRLREFELQRVDAGDYDAWNELKVYADNAHLIGAMQCP